MSMCEIHANGIACIYIATHTNACTPWRTNIHYPCLPRSMCVMSCCIKKKKKKKTRGNTTVHWFNFVSDEAFSANFLILDTFLVPGYEYCCIKHLKIKRRRRRWRRLIQKKSSSAELHIKSFISCTSISIKDQKTLSENNRKTGGQKYRARDGHRFLFVQKHHSTNQFGCVLFIFTSPLNLIFFTEFNKDDSQMRSVA